MSSSLSNLFLLFFNECCFTGKMVPAPGANRDAQRKRRLVLRQRLKLVSDLLQRAVTCRHIVSPVVIEQLKLDRDVCKEKLGRKLGDGPTRQLSLSNGVSNEIIFFVGCFLKYHVIFYVVCSNY